MNMNSVRGLQKVSLKKIVNQYMVVFVLVLMLVIFGSTTKNFISPRNFANILLQASTYGTMAIGMTCLILSGYFDLSAGMVMGISASLSVMLQPYLGLWGSIIITLVVDLLIGFVNGIMVTKAKINAFIVTLSSMLSIRGIHYILTGGNSLSSSIPGFAKIANIKILGLSTLVYVFLILVIIFTVLMRKSLHGRNTYAVGGNSEAAYNAGINVDRTKTINFMLCSVMAGLGGIMTAARMGGTSASLGWPDGAMNIITCVVLGGTSLSGGSGGILYTVGGTLAFAVLRNGLNMKGVTGAWNYIITGLILIGIVYFDLKKHEK